MIKRLTLPMMFVLVIAMLTALLGVSAAES